MDNRSPYKTAAELNVEPWEREGLIALVGPLSRERLRLDMKVCALTGTLCGTVACIGGHLALARGMDRWKAERYVRNASGRWPLAALFYPTTTPGGYGATSVQAARAVVNFLTLGDPRWCDVMRGA